MVASGAKGNAHWKRRSEEGEYLHNESGWLLEHVSWRNCGPAVFEDTESMTREDHEKPYLVLKVAPVRARGKIG